jgi:hypothetical protein
VCLRHVDAVQCLNCLCSVVSLIDVVPPPPPPSTHLMDARRCAASHHKPHATAACDSKACSAATAAVLLLCCCCAAAVLLLCCCCAAAVLLLLRRAGCNHSHQPVEHIRLMYHEVPPQPENHGCVHGTARQSCFLLLRPSPVRSIPGVWKTKHYMRLAALLHHVTVLRSISVTHHQHLPPPNSSPNTDPGVHWPPHEHVAVCTRSVPHRTARRTTSKSA